MLECQLCPDLVASRCRIVPPVVVGTWREGGILFVAEAPGEIEDEQGIPMVGRSGKKLRFLLDRLGICDYAITNAVLCHPAHNRDPRKEELLNCQVWLLSLLDELKPGRIVALGAVATTAINLLPPGSLPRGCKVRSAMHPSRPLYQPSLEPRFEMEVVEALDLSPSPMSHHRYDEADWGVVLEQARVSGRLAVDTETDGEDGGETLLVQLAAWGENAGERCIWAALSPDSVAAANDLRAFAPPGSGRTLIFHKAVFDLRQLGIAASEVEWRDTKIEAYNADRPSTGLKELEHELLGVERMTWRELMALTKARGGLKGTVKSFALALEHCPLEARDYALSDPVGTLLLDDLLPGLPEFSPEHYELDVQTIHLCEEMTETGIPVDRARMEEAASILQELADEHDHALAKLLGRSVNVNGRALPGLLLSRGIRLLGTTPAGKVSADETSLLEAVGQTSFERLSERFETGPTTENERVVYHILAERECLVLRSTFCIGLLTKLGPDGRLRGNFNVGITFTGRLSSDKPNQQNVPKRSKLGKAIRRCFVAPPGSKWLRADLNQIEIRLLAHCADDDELVRQFLETEKPDIHGEVARAIIKMTHTTRSFDDVRNVAKNGVFESIYGGGVVKFARTVGLSLDEAKPIWTMLRGKIKAAGEWRAEVVGILTRQGFLTTILGYQRSMPAFFSADTRQADDGLRTMMDFVVQGSAADVIKVLMLAWWPILQDHAAVPVVSVHDELGVLCPDGGVETLAKKLELTALEVGDELGLRVPLVASAGWADNWADAP